MAGPYLGHSNQKVTRSNGRAPASAKSFYGLTLLHLCTSWAGGSIWFCSDGPRRSWAPQVNSSQTMRPLCQAR